jgi:hypothetical protein
MPSKLLSFRTAIPAGLRSDNANSWKPATGNINSRQVQWLAFVLFALFFLLSLTKVGSFTLDETLFHYPNMINFYQNGLAATFNSQYSAANTPLPYIIVASLAKLVSPSLVLARIVTGVLSFFTLLLAMRLLNRQGANPYSVFVLLFYPYFFVNSFVFYAVNYGLFFALLGLLALDNEQTQTLDNVHTEKGYGRDFLAGICLSLAVLCQQFYLVVPVAIALSRTLLTLRRAPLLPALTRTTIANIILMLPLSAPVFIFIRWHGLTHPNFHVHTLAFVPSTVTAILFVTGFCFIPYLVQSYNSITGRNKFLALVAAILLVTLFRPVFSNFQGPGLFTGITYHLMMISGKIGPWLTTLEMAGLTFCGILVLFALFRSLASAWDYTLFVICLFLAATYTVNTEIGERHLLALIIFLFLLILPRIQTPVARWYPWAMALLGVGYFFYWTFFKYSGM